jgi:hypothetical protein
MVRRLQIIALLGLLTLEACSAADEPADRPSTDAGRDTKTPPRPDVQGADQLDASGGSYADETSAPPDPDVTAPDASSPPADVTVPPDVTIPPLDGPATPDVTVPPDAPPPPPIDSTPDQTVPSCLVTFTVNGVHWDAPEGGADAPVTGRVVRLVGDAANIGSWTPTAGALLAETGFGTWSGTATFRDQQLIEFKFVKLEGITPEWETWIPFDSNRSLRVECFGDGGVLRDAADAGAAHDAMIDGPVDGAIDADVASDTASGDGPSEGAADGGIIDANTDAQDAAGPSDGRVVPVPARGLRYVGDFGVRPPDATK